jgi:amino acid permease
MLTLVKILLAAAALYGGVMWLFVAWVSFRTKSATPEQNDRIERYTFHLGLCCIVALGFLGLLLK